MPRAKIFKLRDHYYPRYIETVHGDSCHSLLPQTSSSSTSKADATASTPFSFLDSMADSSDTKPTTDPTEPKLAETETKLATNPVNSEAETGSKETSTTEGKSSVAGIASNAASSASAAASGMKDSVFSMFGGGAKKEKKVVEEDEEAKNEPSGSSKAQKDVAAGEEVRHLDFWPRASVWSL
jgi:hypothetical protein